MLVRGHPFAVRLPETNGRAHPDVGILSTRPRSADAVQAVAEGDVITDGDAQVADLLPHRAVPTIKPLREPIPERGRSDVSKRRYEVEIDNVRRIE